MELLKPNNITNLITHGGTFHADDIFCVATMRLIGCSAPVKRVFRVEGVLPTDLVFDIGGGMFDHHEENAKKEMREDGYPYAAFGKIMRAYYPYLGLSSEEYEDLDMTFIRGLDAHDNGFGTNVLALSFSNFNPSWDEDCSEEAQMVRFLDAVGIAKVILERKIKRIKSVYAAHSIAAASIDTLYHGVIFLDRFAPIGDYYKSNDDVKWSCFPSLRGGWNISSLSGIGVRNKALMPLQFRGKPKNELPEGMMFCHPSGFMASFVSQDAARKFAKNYL